MTKTSSDKISQLADLAIHDPAYLKESFPQCSNRERLLSELAKTPEQWHVLITDEAVALFTLGLLEKNAVLEKILIAPSTSLQSITPRLKADLERMGAQSLTLRVPEDAANGLVDNGFERRRSLVRLVGSIIETKLMPILPLSNPVKGEIPMLAQLMYDSYEKSTEPKLPSVTSAERLLRETAAGSFGRYSAEASFISRAGQNIVGACLVCLPSPSTAQVMLMFTHPLYRARGLATMELATSMNSLAKRGVQTMKVWVGDRNDVALRLFTKLGFKPTGELVEMAAGIP